MKQLRQNIVLVVRWYDTAARWLENEGISPYQQGVYIIKSLEDCQRIRGLELKDEDVHYLSYDLPHMDRIMQEVRMRIRP